MAEPAGMTKEKDKKNSAKKTPAKKPAVKKQAGRAGGAAVKKKPPVKAAGRSAGTPSGRQLNPLSILIIMGLLAVIVFLADDYYNRKIPSGQPPVKISEDASRLKEPDKEKTQTPAAGELKEEATKTADAAKAPAPALQEVKVYYVRYNERSEKMDMVPVTRKVPADNRLGGALEALIKGPSAQEKDREYLTAVPEGLKVRSVSVRDGSAVIDFSEAIEYGAPGSILLSRIDQIVYTATQFPEVKNVRILINGKKREALGPDGLSISGPLHR